MTELLIERMIPAAPQRVWTAFTTAEGLAAWMWPGSWQTTAEVDLRVGGRYRIASSEKGLVIVGEFVSLDEPARLVQTWHWEGDGEETLVTVTFEPSGEGTALSILHERFGSAEDRDRHIQGWNDCLDRLAPYLLS
jgi:uncharacterized protein YndB with AHSA1/START domain